MKAVLGEESHTLKSRMRVLEDDRTTRIATQAAIGTVLSIVVFLTGSGVVGKLDEMRQEIKAAVRQGAAPRPAASVAP